MVSLSLWYTVVSLQLCMHMDSQTQLGLFQPEPGRSPGRHVMEHLLSFDEGWEVDAEKLLVADQTTAVGAPQSSWRHRIAGAT